MSRPVFATERIGNIRSQHKTAFLSDFLPVVAHRLEHSDAAIGCGASAQTHDEMAHAPAISIHNHLAHAPEVAFIGFAVQAQSEPVLRSAQSR